MAAEDGSNGGAMEGRHSTFIASLFHEFVRQKTGDLVGFCRWANILNSLW